MYLLVNHLPRSQEPFNSADLTEEEKNQLVKLTPEQQRNTSNNTRLPHEENLAKLGVIDDQIAAIGFYTSSTNKSKS